MSDSTTMTSSRERPAWSTSGFLMLGVFLALLALFLWRLVSFAGGTPSDAEALRFVLSIFLLPLALIVIAKGFYMVQPNQAAAITLFAAYRGTDRNAGLRWVWPWMGKTRISVRANNVVSEKLKVNDLRGNPIEIATNVVWRVADTAQALFDVDDYRAFVLVQIEAAVRSIGARYPYDDIEHHEVTLRGDHDVINAELRTELNARLALAGLTVDECGLTHLAYAPEIAGAMLRRQQAEAVVSARARIVDGAVGMVKLGIEQLEAEGVVKLSTEDRVKLVTNLMTVLVSESEMHPVLSVGKE